MSRVLRKGGRIVRREGRRAREGCRSPCCGDGGGPDPGECTGWYKFFRCGDPHCAGDTPPEVWFCYRETRDTQGNVTSTPPSIGQTRLTIIDTFNPRPLPQCYTYNGAEPVAEPPDGFYRINGGTIVPEGCASAACNTDYCDHYSELRQCGGATAGCGPLFIQVGSGFPGFGSRGAILVNCGTDQNPLWGCYCLSGESPVREDQLPPNRRILGVDVFAHGTFGSCCQCGTSQEIVNRCTFVTGLTEWIGPGFNDIRTVDCCCGEVVGVVVSGTHTINGPVRSSRNIVSGAEEYPPGSGAWWYVGTIHGEERLGDGTVIPSDSTVGPPNGEYDFSLPISTECGAYLRNGENDLRFPLFLITGGDPNLGNNGAISIGGGCNGRTENASGDNGSPGVPAESFSSLTFSILIVMSGSCIDDCAPSGQAQPLIAGCGGCGRGGPQLEAFQ